MRPKTKKATETDTGIQESFVIRLTTDDTQRGVVFLEQRSMMGASAVWAPKVQIWPPRVADERRMMPGFETKPRAAKLIPRTQELGRVLSGYKKFATQQSLVKVNQTQKAEILAFVANAPRHIRDVPVADHPPFRSPLLQPRATNQQDRTNAPPPPAPFVPPPDTTTHQREIIPRYGFTDEERTAIGK